MLTKLFGLLRRILINKYTGWFFKTKRRKIITLVLLLLFVLQRINTARQPDFDVNTVQVKKETFVESVTAAGEIKAEKSVDLTFVAAEKIDQIYVDDGAWVKQGEAIAKLNTTNLYHSFKIADENLRAGAAALDVVYDDLKDKEDSETFAEISTRTTAEAAKNNAVFAQIQTQRNLANATIRAPFDGIVNFKDGIAIGKYASVAAPSFSITDPGTVYFEAEISELDVSKLKVGMKALIELDAYNEDVYEELVEMVGFDSTLTSSGGTAYRTKVSLSDNTNNRFRLGMNGDVELVINEEDGVLSIPISALVEEEDGNFVWRVIDGAKVVKTKVEIGVTSINDIEILDGVNENDLVILRPPSKLKEGDKVKVLGDNGDKVNGGGLRSLF